MECKLLNKIKIFSIISILSCSSFSLANEKSDDNVMQNFEELYKLAQPGCTALAGIDKTIVDALESGELIENKRIYCFIGCLMRKMNIIDDEGRLTKWQMMDMYRVLIEDDWNKNAKILTKGLMNDLKCSKGICDAGRISLKFMQTIIERA